MMVAVAIVALLGLTPRGSIFATWAAAPLRTIQRELYRSDRGVYAEAGKDPAPLLDLRGEAELVLAFAAAAAYDAKFLPDLQTAIAASANFWDASGPTPGFSETPFAKAGNRSYADNAALALALGEAARVAKSVKASELAVQALTFALSGEDAKRGGIADREADGSVKTAGATAAVALAVLRQADLSTHKHSGELYDWVRANLRDPGTNLFSTALGAAGTDRGAPEAGDTARMIEIACLLNQSTGDLKYGEQARRLEILSVARWSQPNGGLSTDTLGGAQLVEAWLDRIRMCPRRGETYGASLAAYSALQRLHDAGRNREGHYGRAFGIAPAAAEGWRVLDQAAAARAFFTTALALRPGKK